MQRWIRARRPRRRPYKTFEEDDDEHEYEDDQENG